MRNISKVIISGILFFYFNRVVGASNELTGLDVKGVIEKILEELKANIPEVITLSDTDIVIPQFLDEYVGGTFTVSNASFSGLKEFNATVIYLPIAPLPEEYLITLETLNLNLDYKSDVTFYDTDYLKLFGEGALNITLRNLRVGGKILVSFLPVNAHVMVDVDLDSVNFDVSGLLDDDDFSKQVGRFAGDIIIESFEKIKKPLSEVMTDSLNYIIQTIVSHYLPHQLNG